MGQAGVSQVEGPSHEPKGELMGWSGIQKPPLLLHPKTRNGKAEHGIKTAATGCNNYNVHIAVMVNYWIRHVINIKHENIKYMY